MLTNNVREWEPHWRAKLPIDEIFELVVDSAFVGMRKPDPAIYALVLERLALPAEACLFVDDIDVNVDAARELGLAAIHFRDTEQAIARARRAAARLTPENGRSSRTTRRGWPIALHIGRVHAQPRLEAASSMGCARTATSSARSTPCGRGERRRPRRDQPRAARRGSPDGAHGGQAPRRAGADRRAPGAAAAPCSVRDDVDLVARRGDDRAGR